MSSALAIAGVSAEDERLHRHTGFKPTAGIKVFGAHIQNPERVDQKLLVGPAAIGGRIGLKGEVSIIGNRFHLTLDGAGT